MNAIATKILKKRQEISIINTDIDDLAESVMPEFSFEHTIGSWKCKDSPLGLCVYNHFEDRALDDCIFCHHPSERK